MGAKAGQARAEGCSYGAHFPDATRCLPPGKDDQLPQHPALQQSLHLRAALCLCSIRRVDTGNKIHPAEKALLQCHRFLQTAQLVQQDHLWCQRTQRHLDGAGFIHPANALQRRKRPFRREKLAPLVYHGHQTLPLCQRLYYMDIDLYRYFIGRDDQSVNESVMVKRVDQQLRVTKIMIDAVDLYALPESQKKLRAYMFNYLSMMMAISSVFLTMDGRPEAFEKKTELWQYLKNHDERVYNKCRHSVAGACNLPGTLGHKITLWGYHVAQKIFKFN